MEMSTDSSSCSHQPHLPPGFRFHPTDEELVVHYLRRKAAAAPLPVSIIAEIDLYKHDPWELPAKASFGEHEWYFFSPRDRKYPNGARPNRAATSGYWKATGTDKPIRGAGGGRVLGVKKALVFYGGKPPRGVKTNWIMHEYRLAEGGGGGCKGGVEGRGKKVSLRLDDWVLCRIYQKHSTNRQAEQDILPAATTAASVAAAHIPQYPSASPATLLPLMTNTSELCKRPAGYGAMLAHEEIFYEGLLASASATGPFAVKPPELSLILPDGLVPVPPYCQGKAADGEGGDENCGQIGGYFHYPVLGTYHHLNWSA